MKRKLSLFLTVVMILSVMTMGLFSITASASEVSAPISLTKTGTCGDSARWEYYEETGELKFLGSGAITGELYASGQMKNPPWSSFGADVKSISVANGITSIPEGAFRSCTNLESLSVPFIGKSRTANEGYDQVLGYVFGGTNSNVTGTTLQYQKYVYNGVEYYYLYIYYYIPATLKEVIITDGTKISGNPFRNCKNIRSVGLSDSIVSISSSVFSSCSRITNVWYEGTEDEKNNISIGNYNGYLTSATWHFDSCIKNPQNFTHSFDDCEDDSCSNCDRVVRSAPGHLYNYCTDTKCSSCNKIRIALKHTYSSCTDKTCNSCPFVRADEHQYQNNCDADCDVCGYIRVPSEHIYSNEWDTTCDECGETRIAGPFTIVYHLDGGTNALKNPDVYTSEDIITLKDATKEGYDFAGWFLDAEKKQKITEIPLVGDIDVYAKFIPKKYFATFDDNKATSSSELTVTLDDSNGATKTKKLNNDDRFNPYAFWIPQREGYVFAGWYYNSTLVDDSEMIINSNITLSAKWESLNVKDDVQAIILGEDIKEIFTSGSSFYGKDSNGSTKYFGCSESFYDYDKDYNGYKDYVLYIYVGAQYDTIYYKGSVEGQRNTYGSNGWVDYGSCSISDFSTYYSKDQYGKETFSGSIHVSPGTLLVVQIGNYQWNTSGRYFGQITITLGSEKNSSIKASHERIVEQEFDNAINTPTVSKTGYDFLGWYDNNGNQITDTWTYAQNKTFTAKWETTKYSIAYNLDGGTNHLSNPSFYTIEDSVILQNPSKAGYTFKGWYSDSDFKTKVTTISKQTGNITLYAKWEVNSYNLTIDANNGSFAPKVTFISDGVEIKKCYLYDQDTLTAYRPANKAGYIFAGWYKDASYTKLFVFNGTITEDITLYAKWIECRNNIINIESTDNLEIDITGKTEQLYGFVPLVDGTIVVTSSSDDLDLYGILYDATTNKLIVADDISDDDLDFTFTYNVTAGQLYYIAVKGNTASTSGKATISIDWTGDCTITGSTYFNMQMVVVYDTDYKLPQKPTRKGYVFLGWFDENGVQVTDGSWNFASDKTVTARWDVATQHTVVFKDADGKIISTMECWLGDDIIAPSLPTKSPDHIGSYFSKWDDNYTGVCTGDAVYTVVYDIAEYVDYTVIFKNWNGDVISEQTYHYGDVVTAPASPIKDADNTYTYVFKSWDNDVVNCAGDATYKATYTSAYINYTVVFKNYNDDVISSNTYHYGDAVVVPGTPKKPSDANYCYVFVGWDKSVTNCYGDAVYTAKFTASVLPIATVNNSSARANETVVVNILLSGAPNLGSLAISDISYNTSAFELVSFDWKVADAILSNWDAATGKGALALSTAKDVNGTIISLTFKVKDGTADGNYPVSCTVTSQESDFKNVAGQITVYSVAPGDVDGNESLDKDDAIYLLMHSFFPEDYPINQEADYNGNGMVDKDDAIHLLMHTFFPDDYPLAPAPAAVTITTTEECQKDEDEE